MRTESTATPYDDGIVKRKLPKKDEKLRSSQYKGEASNSPDKSKKEKAKASKIL